MFARQASGGSSVQDGSGAPSSSFLDKLIFEGDSGNEDFLHGLISAKGLSNSFRDLVKRMRGLEKEQIVLRGLASKEAMNRDYIMRKEYVEEVQGELQGKADKHAKKIGVVESVATNVQISIADHRKQLKALQKFDETSEERMDGFVQELDRVDKQECSQHEAVLQLLQEAEERSLKRDGSIWEEFGKVSEHLRGLDKDVTGLQMTMRRQEEFLQSDQLRAHVTQVCTTMLEAYVAKKDMLVEAARCSDHCVAPVRDAVGSLLQRFESSMTRLAGVDATLRDEISSAQEKTAALNKDFNERFRSIVDEVQLRSTVDALNTVDTFAKNSFSASEEHLQRLKAESINKIQEMNARVAEFQILLEDHEHALQHHAEELLNRSTKYDLVVCQQRIDHCAIKDKVDKDFKELQETVMWQSSQLEVLGYGKSFGGGLGGGLGGGQAVYTSSRSGTMDLSQFVAAQQQQSSRAAIAQDFATGSLQEDLREDSLGSLEEQIAAAAAATAALEEASASGAGATVLAALAFAEGQASARLSSSPRPGTSLGSVMFGARPPPEMPVDGAGQAQTEVYSLLRMQMETMAQALLALGRLTRRESPCGLTREQRKHAETELLEHMSCLLHWITNRRAPFSWDSGRLASLALRCMQGTTGDSNFASRSPAATGAGGKLHGGSSCRSDDSRGVSAGKSSGFSSSRRHSTQKQVDSTRGHGQDPGGLPYPGAALKVLPERTNARGLKGIWPTTPTSARSLSSAQAMRGAGPPGGGRPDELGAVGLPRLVQSSEGSEFGEDPYAPDLDGDLSAFSSHHKAVPATGAKR
mmetsp:Transcript_122380/g.391547  ORF Transcript_122380/g.391547 Transcript_122380/m.391547 type:complete len:810 (-) Transcript_122380:69-2498(-)